MRKITERRELSECVYVRKWMRAACPDSAPTDPPHRVTTYETSRYPTCDDAIRLNSEELVSPPTLNPNPFRPGTSEPKTLEPSVALRSLGA